MQKDEYDADEHASTQFKSKNIGQDVLELTNEEEKTFKEKVKSLLGVIIGCISSRIRLFLKVFN